MLIRLFILLLLAATLVGGGYYAVRELYLKPEQKLRADKQLPPPAPPPDPSLQEFDRCVEIRRTQPPAEAKTAFERFLKEFPESRKKDAALDAIGEINSAQFFATVANESNTYVVKAGDSLSRVAARTRLPMELIFHLNQMDRDTLQPGQRLLAPPCDFRVTLQQRARRVVLTNEGKFFRQYPTLSWPGMNKKEVIFLPKAEGKVTEKVALEPKGAVKPTERAYFSASHILQVSIPGHALYTQPADPATAVTRPTGGGIGLAPAHMSEIAILLPRGAPVTLE